MLEKPRTSVPVEKINQVLPEDAEIIKNLTFTIPQKMEEDEFRFMLFQDGIVHFDSHNTFPRIPDAPLEEYSLLYCGDTNYRMFTNPQLPTSPEYGGYSERIRVYKVRNCVMVTKMFTHSERDTPYRDEHPHEPVQYQSFNQLRKDTKVTHVPPTYFHIDCNWPKTEWAWQMEKPRDDQDNVALSLPLIRLELFRNQQMVRTMELEDSKPESGRDLDETHIYVIALIVHKDNWKFIVDHLVYLDQELGRIKCDLFEWLQRGHLIYQMVFDKWVGLRKSLMHIQSCSKLKDPTGVIRFAEFVAKRGAFGKTVRDVLNRLNEDKFVSKLLSAFLMHSLNWVLTDLPKSHETERRARRYFRQNDFPYEKYSLEHKRYLEVIGSCGPHDSVKIIVLGTNERDIVQLCEMLTYFFRPTGELSPEGNEENPSDVINLFDGYENLLANINEGETQDQRYERLLRRVENSRHAEFPEAHEKTQILTDMFAAPVDEFSNYFAVQGMRKTEENQKDFVEKIVHELRQSDGFAPFQEQLSNDAIPQKMYIIADVDFQTVKIVSDKTVADFETPALSIHNVLEDIKEHQEFLIESDFFVELDDALGLLVKNSLTFMEIIKQQSDAKFIKTSSICRILESDITDLKMIFNICSSYFPVAFLTPRENHLCRFQLDYEQ